MLYEIHITPFAENDIVESYRYYLDQSLPKVATAFVEEIYEVFDILEINPFFQIRAKNKYRAIPLKKFPFLIFFEIIEHNVKILRVFNTNLDPEKYPK